MIVYFSGTGNSRMVALMLRHPGEQAIEIPSVPDKIQLEEGERVVWVFPVYAWGLPPVVRRYMKEFPLAPGRGRHFMVCTCGDDVGLTHLEWRRMVKRRGWRPVATFSVRMPNTYVLLPGFDVDTAEVAGEKLSAAPARVRAIARAIRHEARIDDVTRGSVPWIKSRILRSLFHWFLMSPKPFHYTSGCVGCGLCAARCPMDNIAFGKDRRPVWGKDCAMCLQCYHGCPHGAVAYGRATKGKGRYPGPSSYRGYPIR